ncbi:RNA polymerase I-specific transcription initiation factor RRN3-domain-containing protein [Mycena olivaceomarginata]|nr:RNA polymerase I-specific transcription initiation factor RRN3-domain-containing protein [Mycena olivaceomarginata]
MAIGAGNGAQSGVWYAVAQAVFLIFCFRWRDLLEDEEDDGEAEVGGKKKWMPELGVVQRIIGSVLNPLKLCSPNVVGQFANVAQATGFAYCFTILEANKRSEYGANNAEGRVSTPGAGHAYAYATTPSITAELNTFFPFDPYRLVKSGVYIQGIYREWGDAMSSSYGGLTIPRSQPVDRDDDGLGKSLGAMSISPVGPAFEFR